MKDIDAFYDSSEDEDIVDKAPYGDIPDIKSERINEKLTLQRIKATKTNYRLLTQASRSHQDLLKKPAIPGIKEADARRAKKSPFPAPLAGVSTILDAVPSHARQQNPEAQDTIIPSYRGLKWPTISPRERFFSTRANWKGEHHYASHAFKIAGVDIKKHTESFVREDEETMNRHKDYDLVPENAPALASMRENNDKLTAASQLLKRFFQLADEVKNCFENWLDIIPSLRNAKKLHGKTLSLSQILSYTYVNEYSKFQTLFSQLKPVLDKIPNNQQLLASYEAIPLNQRQKTEGMPYLSEGQIPRHALLYAFGVKVYSENNNNQDITPLYEPALKPKQDKVYRGKLLISRNPASLFHGPDKALSVVQFDKDFGGSVIAAVIIGEREIQHQGANVQGVVANSINMKLPKFHHEEMPTWYRRKYGLSEQLYNAFRETFTFLNEKNEYGKLSWMYLETVLLAHLIHFHEVQCYQYANHMAESSMQKIEWHDRKDNAIANPFAPG